jgi:hypothetical protein
MPSGYRADAVVIAQVRKSRRGAAPTWDANPAGL